jgi:hypothetical protein
LPYLWFLFFVKAMKKISEAILRKDSSINKIQFDKEWFYAVEDMEDFLKESLAGVETVTLPIVIDGIPYPMKCATWEDIQRFREEPLDDFKGSVSRSKKPSPKK